MKLRLLFLILLLCSALFAQEEHNHPAPEKLGRVVFPTSCSKAVQPRFERAVALLHSFAYSDAEKAFQGVSASDPACAMAHWGVAMTFYHQLWEPWITPQNLSRGSSELEQAKKLKMTSREQQFIAALTSYYSDYEALKPQVRAAKYRDAMRSVAQSFQDDSEAQVFYALALIANASPKDQSYADQKKAAEILEPIYRKNPQHPGAAHYLIHAYDNSALASRGLHAAREYSKIAPSAPHALHMPSHIFTRLGLWDDSIASNTAARIAAHQQGDIGEELHAMDYLEYAYLQRGQIAKAQAVIDELRSMPQLNASEFKSGYAATAMPVRFAIERQQWSDAAKIEPLVGTAPHVAAINYWSRAIGLARDKHPDAADVEIKKLQECEAALNAAGNDYWKTQTHILLLEAQAWTAQARGRSDEAVSLLRSAADAEDSIEKLPVTPGPIVPAREQLGEMLFTLNHPREALIEFKTSLKSAPGRRGAMEGATRAAHPLGKLQK